MNEFGGMEFEMLGIDRHKAHAHADCHEAPMEFCDTMTKAE